MSRQRSMGGASTARGASSSSDAALHTTQLVERLARSIISERSGRHGSDVVPSEVQIHGAVRLCIRILTSHIGEPLMVEDEASIAQAIRTRLVKVRDTTQRRTRCFSNFESLLRPLGVGPAARESACCVPFCRYRFTRSARR